MSRAVDWLVAWVCEGLVERERITRWKDKLCRIQRMDEEGEALYSISSNCLFVYIVLSHTVYVYVCGRGVFQPNRNQYFLHVPHVKPMS